MNTKKVKIYKSAYSTIWIPVSSKSPSNTARAFLPFNGLEGVYSHGFKARPQNSKYLKALVDIQQSYLNDTQETFEVQAGFEKQRSDKWRHGNKKSAPLLGPTFGWVEIPFDKLTLVTEEELASELERSGKHVISSSQIKNNAEGPMFRSVTSESRTFQLEFRKNAIELWGSKCILSGATCLLEAAHIKGVSACKLDDLKGLTDPFNSLILNVSLHALLDDGLISFSDSGNLLVSDKLDKNDRIIFGVDQPLKIELSSKSLKYLQYHRFNVFGA